MSRWNFSGPPRPGKKKLKWRKKHPRRWAREQRDPVRESQALAEMPWREAAKFGVTYSEWQEAVRTAPPSRPLSRASVYPPRPYG